MLSYVLKQNVECPYLLVIGCSSLNCSSYISLILPFTHISVFMVYIQTETHKPGLTVLADQTNKRVDLCCSDMFLQQLAVVMEQCCDCVLSQDIIANLFLHEAKLFGYILLQDRQMNSLSIHKPKQDGTDSL